MADHEPAQPDPQLLRAVARLAGVDRVLVVDEPLYGESRSTFAVAAGDDELVVKLVPGYCLHATMRQAPRTAALLRRLQALRPWCGPRSGTAIRSARNTATCG